MDRMNLTTIIFVVVIFIGFCAHYGTFNEWVTKTGASPIIVDINTGQQGIDFWDFSHYATQEEIEYMKGQIGIYNPSKKYNITYDGYGTGLTPPTEKEWNNMVGTVRLVESDQLPNIPLSSHDLSTSLCFPIVRSQGQQGSCAAWAATYYTNGYIQAKDHNWEQASTGNNDQLLSPAFTYNKANHGTDGGSSKTGNGKVLRDVGVCRWSQMPYDYNDSVSWGDEDAWRDAPEYRIDTIYTMQPPFDDSDVNSIKNALTNDLPVIFSLNASSYNNFGSDDVLGSTAMNPDTNHAQTIVGYDDSKTDSETGETGAFKIVNSWGISWGPNNNGYYWITYEAFKGSWNNNWVVWFDDLYKTSDPVLLGVWEFTPPCDRDASVELGIGPHSNPLDTRDPWWDGHTHTMHLYPSFMCLDITEFYDEWDNNASSFYLDIGDAAGNDGIISSFKVEYYENIYVPGSPTKTSPESPDTPKTTPGYVTVDFPFEFPELSYEPSSHNFGDIVEGQIYQTTFEIWNSGTGTLSWSLSDTYAWLTYAPVSGSSTGEHDSVTVTIDTTGLSPGPYSGGILISSNGGTGTFTVTFNVLAPSQLAYAPMSHDFGNVLVNSTYQTTFEIWNSGGGTLTWILSNSYPWLSCTPMEGSSTGDHNSVSITLNTSGLSPGFYNATITISSNGGMGVFHISCIVHDVSYGEVIFYAGWNLVTMPVSTGWTAESLGKNISGCSLVLMFNGSTQEFMTHVVGNSYDDFPIVDGVGYFVRVSSDTVLECTGLPIPSVNVTIYEDWNTLGWFHEYPSSAQSLGENTSASLVLAFNARTQDFVTYVMDSGYDNFPISQGMGVFIRTSTSGWWQGAG